MGGSGWRWGPTEKSVDVLESLWKADGMGKGIPFTVDER